MLRVFVVATATLLLAGCGDSFPDYRYRMTVEVVTPNGLKAGSSVIEVQTTEVRTMQDSSGKTFRGKLRGEAVAVDLGNGQTLFALLGSPDEPNAAKGYAHWALKPVRTTGPDMDGYREHLSQMVEVKGVHEMPRDHWPFMVAFSNVNDPASVFEVKAVEVSQVFGSGTYIKRVTIELTGDSVTTDLENHLTWVDTFHGALAGDRRYRSSIPAQNLTARAFRQGIDS